MDNTIISMRHVTLRYKNIVALHDISFDVEAMSIFAFLGPNGAGKSTTVKILTTLRKPDAGSVSIDGINVIQNPQAVKKLIGVVFQESILDEEMSVFANLQLHAFLYSIPFREQKRQINDLLTYFDLWQYKNSIVKTLSGGERRKVEIAQSLLHNPKILFLDEPTAGLDPQTRRYLWQYIAKLNRTQKTTIFLTTHYIEEAERYATDTVILAKGVIIAHGTPAGIMAQTQSATLEDAYLQLTTASR